VWPSGLQYDGFCDERVNGLSDKGVNNDGRGVDVATEVQRRWLHTLCAQVCVACPHSVSAISWQVDTALG